MGALGCQKYWHFYSLPICWFCDHCGQDPEPVRLPLKEILSQTDTRACNIHRSNPATSQEMASSFAGCSLATGSLCRGKTAVPLDGHRTQFLVLVPASGAMLDLETAQSLTIVLRSCEAPASVSVCLGSRTMTKRSRSDADAGASAEPSDVESGSEPGPNASNQSQPPMPTSWIGHAQASLDQMENNLRDLIEFTGQHSSRRRSWWQEQAHKVSRIHTCLKCRTTWNFLGLGWKSCARKCCESMQSWLKG